MKHAIVQRDVAHLVLPDEVQELPGRRGPAAPAPGRAAGRHRDRPAGRRSWPGPSSCCRAAERPAIVVGNGARPHRDAVLALAEHLDAPVISTFKAKGTFPDDHPLGCGVLGRSGIPVASQTVAQADCLLVLGRLVLQPHLDPDVGADHPGRPRPDDPRQVPPGRGAAVGRHRPHHRELLHAALPGRRPAGDPGRGRHPLGRGGARRRRRRRDLTDAHGRLHPALVFEVLGELVPDDAVIAVDVGNNTYSFGHFFECRGRQDVLMSGYLGSIGFALPAALGASVAVRRAGLAAARSCRSPATAASASTSPRSPPR